jgi:hypothetical protein
MDPKTRRILEKITEEQWLDYYNELVIFAEARCRRWTWKAGSRENLPKGFSPESIAREAFRRLYDGDRMWNHDAYPGDNPVPFLKSVIRSIVSDLGRSKAHNTAASLEDESTSANADGETYQKEVRAADGVRGFRPPAIDSPYKSTYFKEVNERIDAAIADRKDLVKLCAYLREGKKPAEIAVAMKKKVEDVYVLIRLFHRRTEDISKELFGELSLVEQRPEGGALKASKSHGRR